MNEDMFIYFILLYFENTDRMGFNFITFDTKKKEMNKRARILRNESVAFMMMCFIHHSKAHYFQEQQKRLPKNGHQAKTFCF